MVLAKIIFDYDEFESLLVKIRDKHIEKIYWDEKKGEMTIEYNDDYYNNTLIGKIH
jgi:hypothetical protein